MESDKKATVVSKAVAMRVSFRYFIFSLLPVARSSRDDEPNAHLLVRRHAPLCDGKSRRGWDWLANTQSGIGCVVRFLSGENLPINRPRLAESKRDRRSLRTSFSRRLRAPLQI